MLLQTIQIWIGVNSDAHPGEEISYAYGTIQGNADGGFMSVGAENRLGKRGQNSYIRRNEHRQVRRHGHALIAARRGRIDRS